METKTNFIKQIIENDLKSDKAIETIVTRFPPEPNGYLHIGHSKSIGLNFGLAQQYQGRCHLRFDDTNPESEKQEYIDAIIDDVKWLGFDWGEHLYFASNYFTQLYEFALELIKKDKAYVCDLDIEQLREYRGNLTIPGKDSPFRNRSTDENLSLFEQMRKGEFKDGEKTLRAKIDMSSPNMNMRDPIIYRIKHMTHPKTGDEWCIYPMYDFSHGLSDAIEGVTHSLCTLEFEDHRPLYDWFIQNVSSPCRPQQIEFAKLIIDYTVTSKRRLLHLVTENFVDGWDDPRMPTLKGLRRRGVTPKALRKFIEDVGVTKKGSTIDMSYFDTFVRDDLNESSPRAFAVLNPLKLVITNFTDDEQMLDGPVHPQNPEMGRRDIPFSNEIYIDKDDFMEDPPNKYFRLKPEGYVRLRYGFIIKCEEVVKNDNGEIVEIRCQYFKDSLGGKTPEGMKKVKGIIHWVSAKHAVDAEFRLYDRMYTVANPLADKEKSYIDYLNPNSLVTLKGKVEPSVKNCNPEDSFQFERVGYFCADQKENKPNSLVFNRTTTLKDTWSK